MTVIKIWFTIFVFLFLAGVTCYPTGAKKKTVPGSGTNQPGWWDNFKDGIIHVVPSTHQDTAWEQTPEACKMWRIQYTLYPVMWLCKNNSNYAYSMESSLSLMEFRKSSPQYTPDQPHYVTRETFVGKDLMPPAIAQTYTTLGNDTAYTPLADNWGKQLSAKYMEELVKKGRISFGGMYVQAYESLESSEQLVRQVYYGRKWLKKNYPGCEPTVVTNVDIPGTSLQMPQILSKAGIKGLWISRFARGLWKWQSPDGSSIITYSNSKYDNPYFAKPYPLLSSGIDNSYHAPYYDNGKKFLGRFKPDSSTHVTNPQQLMSNLGILANTWMEFWKKYYVRNFPRHLCIYYTSDAVGPLSFQDVIDKWNSDPLVKSQHFPRMKHSTQEEFIEQIADFKDRFPLVQGERPNLWLYIHGPGHPNAIKAKRQAAVSLPAVEMFATAYATKINGGNFTKWPGAQLESAWLSALYPDVGWGGVNGYITDDVFKKKTQQAAQLGKEMLISADQTGVLDLLAQQVRVDHEKGEPIIVFNALPWKRRDPVLMDRPTYPIYIVDAHQKEIPSQVIPGSGTTPDQVTFIADVPACGYTTYYAARGNAPKMANPAEIKSTSYSNPFYKIEFSADMRHIISIETTARGAENILDTSILDTLKIDAFDILTMYSGPNNNGIWGTGAGEFSTYQPPQPVTCSKYKGWYQSMNAQANNGQQPVWQLSGPESGPVCTVYQRQGRVHGQSNNSTPGTPDKNKYITVTQKLIVYNTIPLILCEVELDHCSKTYYTECRLALPLNMTGAEVAYEVPMAALHVGHDEMQRADENGKITHAPDGMRYMEDCRIEHPREIQNFISAWQNNTGVTLSSDAAVADWINIYDKDDYTTFKGYPPAWDIINDKPPALKTILQPVLFASRKSCGGNVWYAQDDSYRFRFALKVHSPGWQEGYRYSHQANNPLLAVQPPPVEPGGSVGILPETSQSFFSLSGPGAEQVTITAVKKCEDDNAVIIRLNEVQGNPVQVTVHVPFTIGKAWKTDMIEEQPVSIPCNQNSLTLNIGKYAIETIKLMPR